MSTEYEEFLERKEKIRTLVSSGYDIQKLRVATGNRIVQSFYQQSGVKQSTEVTQTQDEQKENDKMIKLLIQDYDVIADALANKENFKTAKSAIAGLQNEVKYIHDEFDYKLIDSYVMLRKSEDQMFNLIKKEVHAQPMWNKFFAGVTGCGETMAAICLAYLDPYKARHVSSFFRYCGVDTVRETDDKGRDLFCKEEDRSSSLYELFDAEGTPHYYDCETDEEYTGKVYFKEHGRRKGDVEVFDYTAKDGTIKQKNGLTYNPFVKTKLLGVLATSFRMTSRGDNTYYCDIMNDYKARLQKDPKHANKTAAHIENMARRYAIKQFLRDMWVCWRDLEGLEVDEPYEVAKLGMKPHKYNQYQHEIAEAQAKRITA